MPCALLFDFNTDSALAVALSGREHGRQCRAVVVPALSRSRPELQDSQHTRAWRIVYGKGAGTEFPESSLPHVP